MTEQNKPKKKKGCLMATLVIFGSMIFFLILSALLSDSNSASLESDSNDDTIESKFIKGIAPVDVYLNLKKRGFEVDYVFSADFGYSWICKMSEARIDYEVTVFSSNDDFVERVKASVLVNNPRKDIIATQQFFKYITSLPYEGSDPAKVARWIEDSYNEKESALIVSDVEFRLFAPSLAARLLIIEKKLNNK